MSKDEENFLILLVIMIGFIWMSFEIMIYYNNKYIKENKLEICDHNYNKNYIDYTPVLTKQKRKTVNQVRQFRVCLKCNEIKTSQDIIPYTVLLDSILTIPALELGSELSRSMK